MSNGRDGSGVYRASWAERQKRFLWLFVSTFIVLVPMWGIVLLLIHLTVGYPVPDGLGFPIGIVTAGLAYLIDAMYVFPWGVERFDLVIPYQFREADTDE